MFKGTKQKKTTPGKATNRVMRKRDTKINQVRSNCTSRPANSRNRQYLQELDKCRHHAMQSHKQELGASEIQESAKLGATL